MGKVVGDDPNQDHQSALVEEIQGLIRLHKDGHVDRPQIMPCVGTSLAPELGVTCIDMIIDKYTNIWARLYVPNATKHKQHHHLPLLLYFHGGGFCVGSPSWTCYHQFLSKLASSTNCVVASVNYRLAPENPLPAAYHDGAKALPWLLRQQELNEWWAKKCDFSRVFLGGDSAGANIAYNVALRAQTAPFGIKGLVLIQPFFGGEARTHSERYLTQPPRSALTLAASDAYWRMSLPSGADRDHPWCNPRAAELVRGVGVMVCVAEMDILRDRNLEFCESLRNGGGGGGGGGRRVEVVVCKGVGHAFQILDKSPLSQTRTHQMISHINDFVNTCN